MENNNSLKKEHKFFDKHLILGLIVMMFGSMLLSQGVLGFLIGLAINHFTGMDSHTAVVFGAAIGGLIMLFFHFIWFRPEYKWRPTKKEFFTACKFVSPILIFWTVNFTLDGFFAGRFPFGAISAAAFGTTLAAGVAEEVAFRELPISYMARRWTDEKYILAMVLIPGIVFGLMHLTNALLGSMGSTVGARDIWGCMRQATLSIFFGIFFSAVYVRTACIWPLLITHILHDALVLSASAYIEDVPDWMMIVWFVIEGGLALYGLYLVRKEKHREIMALWNRKWSRTL